MPTELAPCSKCGHGRPPNIELSVRLDSVPAHLAPLIIERIEAGGMCWDCAKREVEFLIVSGKVE